MSDRFSNEFISVVSNDFTLVTMTQGSGGGHKLLEK